VAKVEPSIGTSYSTIFTLDLENIKLESVVNLYAPKKLRQRQYQQLSTTTTTTTPATTPTTTTTKATTQTPKSTTLATTATTAL
jgi:hypothetical protein